MATNMAPTPQRESLQSSTPCVLMAPMTGMSPATTMPPSTPKFFPFRSSFVSELARISLGSGSR
jgi:hypothetical protein